MKFKKTGRTKLHECMKGNKNVLGEYPPVESGSSPICQKTSKVILSPYVLGLCKSCRCASELDWYLGVGFKFYTKLYFLRLTLPGRIVENGSEQGSYDADKESFTIRLPKETPEGTEDEDAEFVLEIEQTTCEEVSENPLQSQCQYGFGNSQQAQIQSDSSNTYSVYELLDQEVPVLQNKILGP
ncbi:hypothetical protein STEG23_027734 [Scotinomys teguina]